MITGLSTIDVSTFLQTKTMDNPKALMICERFTLLKGGDPLGSVIKKRRKKMRKHKHRKLLARTRHQRRKGK
jgi:hypothetical protein